MRASRATELVNDFPDHVVTAWMGHSKKIAQKHYLQVTEEDYKQASSNPTQNPTQQITVSPRRGSQPILSAHEKTLVLQGLAIIRETLQTREVGDEGLRPISFEALKTGLLYTFQKPSVSKSVSTPTLSGFTAMVAKKWRGLSDAEKTVLAKLLECEETTPASAVSLPEDPPSY